MARRKEESVHVPVDAVEAAAMVEEYVEIERNIMLERLSAEAAIDKVKAQRDAAIAALQGEAKPLFGGLKAWWEAGGSILVAGKKRSGELANAKIGIRLTPPAVKLARKIKLADVVTWLRTLRWIRKKNFIRTKVELDKQAVIKAVQAEPKVAEKFAPYLTVQQVDEFFIDTGLDEDTLKKEIAAS